MENCEIHIWTFYESAGYRIINKTNGDLIEMNEGSPKESVLKECENLSRVTGMKIIID